MNREQRFIKLAAMLVLMLVFMCASSIYSKTTEDKGYNLLVIMTDQQRFDALGAAGNTVLKTPNLDKLAAEGVMFENAYTPCPVCGPARTSLLSGKSLDNTQVFENGHTYDPDQFASDLVSYDMILSDAGYKTGYYGKWHSPQTMAQQYDNIDGYNVTATSDAANLGTTMGKHYRNFLDDLGTTEEVSPESERNLPGGQLRDSYSRRAYVSHPIDRRHGWSRDDVYDLYSATEDILSQPDQHGVLQVGRDETQTAAEALGLLDALDDAKGEQFSLTVSFHFPHPPFVAQQHFYDMYDPDDMLMPYSIFDPGTDSPYGRNVGEPYNNPEKISYFIAEYYALVTEVDDWVGKILRKLEDMNVKDNTLIVFTSDHGEMMGSHGMRSKNNFFEESAHIPFIMRLPGEITAGTRVKSPVATLDMFPTMLDYLGHQPPVSINGSSLRDVVDGKEDREFVVSEWRSTSSYQPNYMIRKGNWKLIISREGSKPMDAMYYLGNGEEPDAGCNPEQTTCSDKYEMRNLLRDGMRVAELAVAQELKDDLVGWLHDVNADAAAQGIAARTLPAADPTRTGPADYTNFKFSPLKRKLAPNTDIVKVPSRITGRNYMLIISDIQGRELDRIPVGNRTRIYLSGSSGGSSAMRLMEFRPI